MANTTNANIRISFPIVKVDKTDDGDLLVWGRATDGSVDSDQQIVDPTWAGKALTDWLSTGANVRVMHSPSLYPAGRGVEVDSAKGDGHWVRSLIVEPTAKRLVEKGVLQAYSVGIANPIIHRDSTAKGGRIVGGQIAELSLVDRPANKNCGITLVKGVDGAIVDVDELWGDLTAALEAAEQLDKADMPGKAKPGAGGDPSLVDPTDAGGPDDDSDPSADADVDDDHEHDESDDDDTDGEKQKAYRAAVVAYKAAEPKRDGVPLTGTEYLAKAAAWSRWTQQGEAEHLDGSYAGFVAWSAVNKDITLTSPDASGLVPYNLQGADTVKGKLPKGKQCPGCDMFSKASAAKCKGCGKKFPMAAVKGGKDCSNCGKGYDADAKMRRCEGCGKKLPKGDMAKVDKGAGDVVPVEDDGGIADLFEYGDETPSAAAYKADGTSAYVLKRTHDALCAAYDWDTVVDEYPALKGVGDVCDDGWWSHQIPTALAKGDMAGVAFLANAATVAEALGNTDPSILADVRATVHKSFADMYPTATLHPGTVTPGQFQRPYLSAGRAAPNATGGVTPNIPAPVHTINPDQFDRGLITAGHEAGSPGGQPGNARLDTVRTGSARALYTSASKAAAQTAMQAMHDHIATTLPDMCPMAPSRHVMPTGMQDEARPMPYKPLTVPMAPGEKTETATLYKAVKVATKAARRAEKAAAMLAATGADQVADYETTIAALNATIDELGAQPDPAQAPLRGAIGKAAATTPSPVEKRSLHAEAQDAATAAEQREYVQYLGMMSKSADPGTREQAMERLEQLLTKSA